MPEYIPVIGMEVHVELKTASKMFCSCKNDPDENEPNKNICEICTAQPGTLPVPNKKAIEWTVKIGKALGCSIRELSKFDRKHYFYPDLPKGYQISQYDEPIAEHGKVRLEFVLEDNIRDVADIGITRAHLEEDTAKLLHDDSGSTLVDFNRAGTPLVEIVTDPDFLSATEAKMYCQELRILFRALEVSDADMEKGHMRCEANISVQEAGTFEIVDGVVKPLDGHTLNAKVELKNLNSFKAVERGIQYEIVRQTNMIEKGETWIQQTRGWDEDKGETVLQRIKENAADYRYFPDPDIPPFHPISIAGHISLPELPQATRARFHAEYGLSYADARFLSEDKIWTNFTDQTMSELFEWLHALPEVKGDSDDIIDQKKNKVARLASGWITSKLGGILNEKQIGLADVACSAENFAELIALIYTGRVNATNAHKILLIMVGLNVDKDPTHIMEEKGWGQVSDEIQLGAIVDRIIADNPTQAAEFTSGKETTIKFLIGMCMRATEGSADPEVIEKLLREKLSLS
ncbi:MAG: Asp-tRNA(Asn)/Glu-tRNA(Gln) amidotransferase subunit GatB [Candidatus Magasanikbacteria bacterium CG_4_9_14_0_2_um_filter_41_10]|uniref:Aspartyl/glutamyl-tRNA(Asn/Gln) amidotransferase subunit B n=1 Tax=Candidatus Magasanikbacteria bacterium CG_4_10_14_0_2_um_filter_41_31 TaxID=1974639 RepID=A0A2M7V4X8_9BACT|nr:MAG: glutaminyl-tRNA synthase (glutamine-hydrolyzing) subunit B [Candidatus Magasanikbacteria bacterium CG1_02_41_34]PIZ93621.1 MAG: Asp-tRNA(Asn)/Glu-tRNA(Gln) amidotransferase subunit GatB [Candidatus Magasanikbacteria bacterium CG_4_10_14_0_2_um_filter_41_31]PJC53558.1 MAG: Asp-tRNA(Asn)/Glu-tRNA(Gln) amidotransferase subunit GatB [Candidatus Magasanikbacteria bacterium CG_4_9_14_0_2_um_filter_41_10]